MANGIKLQRVDVIQAMNLDTESTLHPDDPTYAWRFLADGDAGFTIGAIPSSNLLYELRLRKSALVLNLGYPGNTIGNIARFASNNEFARRLESPQWASKWDAILMSAGGNDLIDWSPDLLRDKSRSPSKGKPILVHTYDYSTPRPAPANFLFVPITKPWMLPAFQNRGVPESLYIPIADYLLDGLAQMLADLAKDLPAFHVVDTLGILDRATLGAKGISEDWLNEIHPNSDSYGKLADRIAEEIHSLLSN